MSATPLQGRFRYYAITALMQTAICIGGFAVPLLAKHVFHASPLVLGLLGSLGMGSYVLSTVPAGRLSDRIGRRVMIFLGVLLLAVVHVSMMFCPSVTWLCLLAVLWGMAQALLWPALEAAIADSTPAHELPTQIGIFNVTWCTGFFIGTWLSGRLHDTDPRLPFAWAAGVGLCALPFLLKRMPAPHSVTLSNDPIALCSAAHETAELSRILMYLAWGANFVSAGLLGVMRTFFAADVTVRLGFSAQKAALLVAAIQMAETLMFLLLTFYHRWRHRFSALLLAQVSIFAGVSLVIVSVSTAPLALGFLLIGTGASVTYTASIYYSLEGLHNRGVKGALHEAFGGAGSSSAPLVGGWLAVIFGDPRTPYAMCAVVLALGMIVQSVAYRWLRSRLRG